MKARTIRKLRKIISKEGYYEKRWDMYAERCYQWKRFNRFECNSFVVGSQKAERNQYIYDTKGMRDIRKCDYCCKKVKGVNC